MHDKLHVESWNVSAVQDTIETMNAAAQAEAPHLGRQAPALVGAVDMECSMAQCGPMAL